MPEFDAPDIWNVRNKLKKLSDKKEAEEEKTDKEIWKLLEKLPNYLGDCNCSLSEQEPYEYVHHGEWDEHLQICLNCGGHIWSRSPW